MLRRSAIALRASYPTLRVHGIVADYEHHLEHLPAGERRLVLFLGSTIGNFSHARARRFMRDLAERLSPGDWLLIGMDLVKPVGVLHAAYNDARGLTAEFNRNVLRVLNRELGATFAPERFQHVAFFNPQRSQIEMYLRADAAHEVLIPALDLTVTFAAGETIHTEISRKFTRADAEGMLAHAGCRLERWFTADEQQFALALGVVGG
jgi:L-histidine N-alpha-methyltransferase